jgi:RNA polymerase sigma-70 factor, ECF subfamily
MDEVTDLRLVEAARRGEADAFGELAPRHQKQAFAVAMHLIGDPAEAEDLTQEAFIIGLRGACPRRRSDPI